MALKPTVLPPAMVMAWLGETLFKMVRVYVTVKVTVLPLLTKVKVFFPGLSVTSNGKAALFGQLQRFPVHRHREIGVGAS